MIECRRIYGTGYLEKGQPLQSNDVALVRCKDYDRDLVEEQVARAFKLLGGPGAIIGEGESVFIKVNAFIPASPEKAATTHPEVVRAVVRQLQAVTSDITIGDSPGGPYNQAILKRFYRGTGFAQVALETGAALNFDTSVVQKAVPDGKTMKRIPICGAMDRADRLVSIPKFKTHLLVNITGAIKNLFGAVPGASKFTYHARFNDPGDFADFLVDVMLATSPDFHVVDAVVGMDGNGPRQGDIKQIGFIAAGRDTLAVETAMMRLVGVKPVDNRALYAAIKRGMCPGEKGDINTLGDDPGGPAVERFRLPDKRDISTYIPRFLQDRFGNWVAIRPYPDPEKCTGCGKCADICPRGAISLADNVAGVDLRKCIRCYCCHELCEHDAIELERPVLLRLVSGRSNQ